MEKEIGRDIEDRLKNNKTFLEKFTNSLSSPVFLTALLTAVAAPLVTGIINDQIHQRNVQTKILEAVIQTAEKSDFASIDHVERIQIIANMVNENSEQFGISLTNTIDIVNAKFTIGAANLKSQIVGLEDDILTQKDKMSADSSAILQLKREKKDLIDQKKRGEKNLDAKIKKKDDLIKALEEKQRSSNDRLSTLNGNLESLNSKLVEAKRERDDLFNKTKTLEAQKARVDTLLSSSKRNEEQLVKALRDTQENLDAARLFVANMREKLSVAENGYQKLSKENMGYKIEIDNLKLKLRLASVPSENLKRGNSGESVGKLQQILFDLGYFEGDSDKIYGPATVNALLSFQIDANIDTTSIAGQYEERTRVKLQNRYVSWIEGSLNI